MDLEGVEYPIQFNKSVININTGILVDLGRVGFDLRYEYSFKSINTQRVDYYSVFYGTNVAHLQTYKPSQFIISIHLNLIKINANERRKRVKKGWRIDKCFKY